MSKIKGILCIHLIITVMLCSLPKAYAEETNDLLTITRQAGYHVLDKNKPKASIVIDGTSGQVLWQEEADTIRDPASISKMMTVFLVLEAIETNKISYDTLITATKKDQSISQIYEISNNKIVAGVSYSVSDLLSMVMVPSSNAATVMLANQVSDNNAGSFVKRMNQKAKQLGMTNTNFYNCGGAAAKNFKGLYTPEGYDPNGINQSTARDLAILTFHLINQYPEVLKFTNQSEVTTMAGTPYQETFKTYNYSLPGARYGLDGVDGLKTGSSSAGAFNYVATAKRGNTRLIEVILGVGHWQNQEGEYDRHPFGNALLEKMFATYEYQEIVAAGKHRIEGKEIILSKPLVGVVKKGKTPTLKIKNRKILANTGLPMVDQKLHPPSVKYTPAPSISAQLMTSFFQSLKFIVPLILLCIFSRILFYRKRKPRRNSNQKTRRFYEN